MTGPEPVLVVLGVGGMGLAIARLLGPGRTVLIGDHNLDTLGAAAKTLAGEGLIVVAEPVDLGSRDAVAAFASRAAELGPVHEIVCTAGVLPEQAGVEQILQVDLLGVARLLEAFEPVVARGGSAVVIASLAGHLGLHRVTPDQERALAIVPAEELLGLPWTAPSMFANSQAAYGFAKQANRARVRAAAMSWGRRGARVNSISPGFVATPMGERELAGSFGGMIATMLRDSPSGRAGTADDVAFAVQFLVSPGAAYITGTDLLLDGGVLATITAGARHGQ